jgi:hypothetical protein
LILYGADCRELGCPRRFEILDAATGQSRYLATHAQYPGLGDLLTGVAVRDGLIVFGDSSPFGPDPYCPLTSTVRVLSTYYARLYVPVAVK